VIGTYDAADINFVSGYLAKLVKETTCLQNTGGAPLYTKDGDQLQANQTAARSAGGHGHDGWGAQARKRSTYQSFIWREPVQFTGFKLFYKKRFSRGRQPYHEPDEVLKLKPRPILHTVSVIQVILS